MKKLITVCMFLSLVFSVHAVEYNYSKNGEWELDQTDIERNDLLKQVDKRSKEDKNIVKVKENHNKHRIALQNKYSLESDDVSEDTMVYVKKEKLNGIEGRGDKITPKALAIDFVKTAFPEVLGKGENIEILYVSEDYGADQTKDENGKIKNSVDIKTYSYSVMIGRKLFGKAVFGSYATVDYDASTFDLIGFKFNNWIPVTNINKSHLDKLNKKVVHNMIDKRLSSQEDNGNIQDVTVDEIILGWCFNEAADELIPAFAHYGFVQETDEKGLILEKKYSFLEKIGDTANVKKDDTVDDEKRIFFEKSDPGPKPKAEKTNTNKLKNDE